MRYFRHSHTNQLHNNALKEHYRSLTKDEKKTFCKERFWRRFATILGTVCYVVSFSAGICLLKLIPMPNNSLLEILVMLGKVIAGIVLLIACGFLTYGVCLPLIKKVESYNIPAMKKIIFSKACSHLRDYYGLQEPYIITKCFDSSNKVFKDHDVCIFVIDDELRITTDLISGFLYPEKDLGCYSFKKNEIVLTKISNGNHLILELKASEGVSDEIVFLLGYRAKGFIKKNFLNNDNK